MATSIRIITAITALLALVIAAPATAQTFKSGASVEVDGGTGPIFAAGARVRVTGEIRQGAIPGASLFAAGADVEVSADIDGEAFLAGGSVEFNGAADDIALTGGSVTFGSLGRARGDAALAGAEVVFEGEIDREGNFAGETVTINGVVRGDVEAVANTLIIGPDARIEGDLDYESPNEAQIDPDAEVLGETDYKQADSAVFKNGQRLDFEQKSVAGRAFGALFWFVAFGASGALFRVLFPGWTAKAVGVAHEKPVGTLIAGVLILIATPIVAILSMVTVIGLPFGVLLLAFYGGVVFVSMIGAAFGLGHLLFQKNDDGEPSLIWFFAGLAIILVIGAAPLVGGLASFLAASFGVGALGFSLWRSLRV